MPPSPKPHGQRVRRNTGQPQWQSLPAAQPFKRPPPHPKEWSDRTVDWWALIWRSPMATLWIETDVPELAYLGDLMELPKKSAEHYAEIRQLKDRYGLNPKARKALFWHIPLEDDAEAERPMPKVRQLRAV